MTNIFGLFEMGQGRYQPDPSFTYADDHPGYRLDQRRLAFFVGLIALGLPIVMLIGVIIRTCLYDSISHFYYAQFLGGVFIAALVFIGTFLLAYRGESARESRLATIAGFGAIIVSLFPTNGRGCDLETFSGRALADFKLEVVTKLEDVTKYVEVIQSTKVDRWMAQHSDIPFERFADEIPPENPLFFELFSGAQYLHGGGATVLFAFLAWYSFFVFTRVIDNVHLKDGNLTPQKRIRNNIYRASGVVIVFSMAVMVIGHFFFSEDWNDNNLTFWFESLALWAFGFSWMVKGRFFDTVWLDEREMQIGS